MAITLAIRDRILREAPELQGLLQQAEGITAGYPNINNGHEGQVLDESLAMVQEKAGRIILDLLANAT